MNEELKSQGLMDILSLLSKENIDKVNKILKAITVEELEDGVTRISIDIKLK